MRVKIGILVYEHRGECQQSQSFAWMTFSGVEPWIKFSSSMNVLLVEIAMDSDIHLRHLLKSESVYVFF